MICLVLAGGSGDRLWPLSRKNYPKQFVNLVGSHSLFQEAILRNMPFCEEFWIFTAQKYRHIAEGQLQVFQGLKYRCFCEEEGRRTLPALVLACLCANPSENFLVVSSDHVIEGEAYKEAVLKGREQMVKGKLCCVGAHPQADTAGCGFLKEKPDGTVDYRYAAASREAAELLAQGGWLWDTGIVMGRAGDFLQEAQLHCPELLEEMKKGVEELDLSGRFCLVPAKIMQNVVPASLGEVLTVRSHRMQLLRGEFSWRRIVDLESLEEYRGRKGGENVLQAGCQNLTVVNTVPRKLIVASGVADLSLVDTPDALYISRAGETEKIKELMAAHPEHSAYFDEGSVLYTTWGSRERLSQEPGCRVEKIQIYPGCQWECRPDTEFCQCTVAKGTASFAAGEKTERYNTGMGFAIKQSGGAIANEEEETLVLVCVSVGEKETAATEGTGKKTAPAANYRLPLNTEKIVRLEPAFHDNLWGGTRLRDLYGKKCDYQQIGESWELSAHEAGQSTVATGRFKGMLFGEYLERIGREHWGWKCQHMMSFPLLIKLIDAREDLSIQVHPDDDYALEKENSYGKNEMWHILDCTPDAYIYCGFTGGISKEEIRRRIHDGTLQQVMRRVPVQKGMTVFIPSGTVHAIGAGILLCEVQQSSDLTYRLYDYGRKDAYGKPRMLHEKQALEVLTPEPFAHKAAQRQEGQPLQELCNCKYFSVYRREVQGESVLLGSEASFTALMFLEGSGTVQVGDTQLNYKEADCFFVPAGEEKIIITGQGSVLQVQV